MPQEINNLMQAELQANYIRKLVGNIDAAAMMQTQIVFYFISTDRSVSIQRIDLKTLNQKTRALYQENCERIIPVVKKGDEVRAKVSPEIAAQLKQERKLKIDGQDVEVDVLSKEEFDELSSVTQAIFEELAKNEEARQQASNKSAAPQHSTRAREASSTSVESSHVRDLLIEVQSKLGKISLRSLQSWSEVLREIAERNKERREKEDIARKDQIQKEVIRRDVFRHEGQQNQIKTEAVKQTVLA